MAQVIMPPQRPRRDAIDLISTGLQAAQAIYGIRADMAKLDEYKQNQEMGKLKLKEAQDEQQGILTPSMQQKLSLSGAKLIPQPNENSDPKTAADFQSNPIKMQARMPDGTIGQVAIQPPPSYKIVEGTKGPALLDEKTFKVTDLGLGNPKALDNALKVREADLKDAEFKNSIQKDFAEKVKDPLEKYDNAATVKNLANLNTPMADRYLNTALIPMLSGMNRMNETEIKNSSGSPGLLNQAKQLIQKAETGTTYTPEDRAAIVQMANVFQNFAKQQVVKTGHDYASQKANILPMTQADVYDKLLQPEALFNGRNGMSLDQLAVDQSQPPAAPVAAGQQLPTLLQPGQLYNKPQPSSWTSGFGGTAQAQPPQAPQKFNPDAFIQQNRRR